MKKKKWYRVLAAVLAAIVLFSSFMVIRELLTKQKEKKEFDELAELVVTEEDSDEVHLPVKRPEGKKTESVRTVCQEWGLHRVALYSGYGCQLSGHAYAR